MESRTLITKLIDGVKEHATKHELPKLETPMLLKLEAEREIFRQAIERESDLNLNDKIECLESVEAALLYGIYTALDFAMNGQEPIKDINRIYLYSPRVELFELQGLGEYDLLIESISSVIYQKTHEAYKLDKNNFTLRQETKDTNRLMDLYMEIGKIGMKYYQKLTKENTLFALRGHKVTPEQLLIRGYEQEEPNQWIKEFPAKSEVIEYIGLGLSLENGKIKDYDMILGYLPFEDVFELPADDDYVALRANGYLSPQIRKEMEELLKL